MKKYFILSAIILSQLIYSNMTLATPQMTPNMSEDAMNQLSDPELMQLINNEKNALAVKVMRQRLNNRPCPLMTLYDIDIGRNPIFAHQQLNTSPTNLNPNTSGSISGGIINLERDKYEIAQINYRFDMMDPMAPKNLWESTKQNTVSAPVEQDGKCTYNLKFSSGKGITGIVDLTIYKLPSFLRTPQVADPLQ
jgi:hypothetical protein